MVQNLPILPYSNLSLCFQKNFLIVMGLGDGNPDANSMIQVIELSEDFNETLGV